MSEVENQEVETVEVSAVEELIGQISSGDLNNAEGSFKSIVQDKLNDALEAQRIATAQAIFNGSDDDLLDDVDDVEVEVEVEEEELDTEDEIEEVEDDADDEDDEEVIAELDDDESVQ